MDGNENNNKKIIDKAEFYKTNEIVSHVLTVPKGTFKNGRFVSGLEQGKFFWFIEKETSIPIRLFLSEIFDVEDYREREKKEDGGENYE